MPCCTIVVDVEIMAVTNRRSGPRLLRARRATTQTPLIALEWRILSGTHEIDVEDVCFKRSVCVLWPASRGNRGNVRRALGKQWKCRVDVALGGGLSFL